MAQMKAEQTRNAVIGPFAAQNPRFNEPAIQQSIAQIVKSDMVSKALPAQERLAAAYDMAVRLNPSADDDQAPDETHEEAPPTRVERHGGYRQIKAPHPSGRVQGPAKRMMSRDEEHKTIRERITINTKQN